MCPSYVENFHDKRNGYVKILYHFYCKFKDDHEHFIHSCKYHPRIVYSSCSWKSFGPSSMYDFCVQIKCLINFRTHKFCVKSLPENMAPSNLVPINQYLRNELNKGEPFLFYFFSVIR